MSQNPRIAVIGVGSIGSRHIDNLLDMGYQDLVGVDPRPMQHDERLPIVDTLEDIEWWEPTHALICSPPEFHYHHAKHFVDRGIHTFIEKPMTVSSTEASALCATAHMNKSVIAVGYMERAHPCVVDARNFVMSYGCDMVEICCYWKATDKTYGLDTAQESSHAIDLAVYLLGEPHVISDHHHNGECTLKTYHHSCGANCIIRMNMQEWPRRIINILAPNGQRFSEMYGETKEEWDDCYKAELQAFLAGRPLCTGEDGLKVVGILERMK